MIGILIKELRNPEKIMLIIIITKIKVQTNPQKEQNQENRGRNCLNYDLNVSLIEMLNDKNPYKRIKAC